MMTDEHRPVDEHSHDSGSNALWIGTLVLWIAAGYAATTWADDLLPAGARVEQAQPPESHAMTADHAEGPTNGKTEREVRAAAASTAQPPPATPHTARHGKEAAEPTDAEQASAEDDASHEPAATESQAADQAAGDQPQAADPQARQPQAEQEQLEQAAEDKPAAAEDTRASTEQAIRTPPEGTSPAAAAAFRRIPVGRDDRRPVGEIGRSGIHVDRIAVGSEYERGNCSGKRDRFSVGDEINVCFQVVHRRRSEPVVVVWQHGDTTVGKVDMNIPAHHSYRTRSHVEPDENRTGSWSVRVLSKDGAVLARDSFTVTE